MAEAAGLALGGIALASLVSTCVEFIEHFEDGRDCMRDFSLAVTKVKLMKIRLGQLGGIDNTSIGPHLPDGDAGGDWHHVSSAIPDSASGIMDIIQRATKICRRYSYGGHDEASMPGPQAAAQSSQEQRHDSVSSGETLQGPTGRRATLQAVRRSISWAFHDKKKFNGLISDLDFILCNLEKITEGSATSTKSKPYQETPHVNMNETQNTSKKRAESCGNSKRMDEKNNASKKPDVHASQIPAPSAAGSPRMKGSPPKLASEVSFTENRSKGQSVRLVGGQRGDWDKADFRNNESHDQSLALTGTYAEPSIEGITKMWVKVAMHAMNQQGTPAKASVRTSSSFRDHSWRTDLKLTGATGANLCRDWGRMRGARGRGPRKARRSGLGL
jgi:hypothetical protein